MEEVSIYIDESGDLGWKFDAPYRKGGSSRYLTISAILIDHNQRHLLKRIVRKLGKKMGVPPGTEIKWANMHEDHRLWIAQTLAAFKRKHGDSVQYFSLSVRKEKVREHIRKDANKLYNYMIKLMLAEHLTRYERVRMNIDQRTIKVESGNSLHDYLQTVLWLEYESATRLDTKQCDSKNDLCVQLADILSGIVQSHFEDGRSAAYRTIRDCLNCRRLFF